MTNLVKKSVVFVTILAVSFLFIGCVHSPTTTAFSGVSNNYIMMTKEGLILQANIPIKEFTTLGLIFVESSAIIDSDEKIIDGSKITYEMLMKEAQKLGADDIINLRIDEIENISVAEETRVVQVRNTEGNLVDRERTVQIITRRIDYKANALAIKYKQ